MSRLFCFICANSIETSIIKNHIIICENNWMQNQETLPKNEHISCPKFPEAYLTILNELSEINKTSNSHFLNPNNSDNLNFENFKTISKMNSFDSSKIECKNTDLIAKIEIFRPQINIVSRKSISQYVTIEIEEKSQDLIKLKINNSDELENKKQEIKKISKDELFMCKICKKKFKSNLIDKHLEICEKKTLIKEKLNLNINKKNEFKSNLIDKFKKKPENRVHKIEQSQKLNENETNNSKRRFSLRENTMDLIKCETCSRKYSNRIISKHTQTCKINKNINECESQKENQKLKMNSKNEIKIKRIKQKSLNKK